MERTPKQVLDEIDTLSQALAELSSAVREQTRSESSSARNSPRASPSLVTQTPGPFRRLTPGERKLEETKSSARKSLAVRTEARIEQLQKSDDRRRASYAHESSGERHDAFGNPVTKRQQERTASKASESFIQEDPEIVELNGTDLPTAVKRNITVRRSRERRSEPTGKLPKDLIAKRATGRTRDIQYRRQSGIYVAENLLDSSLHRGGILPDTTTTTNANSVNFLSNPFLKRDIPEKDANPQMYDVLMKLYDERQELYEDIQVANQDGLQQRVGRLQKLWQECNQEMHELWQSYNREHLDEPMEEFHSTSSYPSEKLDNGSDPDRLRTKSVCPPNQIQFIIHLVYKDSDLEVSVWDSMNNSILFGIAFDWIVRVFNLEIDYESIILKHNDLIVPMEGFLFEIPIEEGDVVEAEIGFYDSQLRMFDNEERKPQTRRPPFNSSRSGMTNRGGRTTLTPRQPAKARDEENQLDSGILTSGLDSKSYDKIRASFKCPKFSGKTKDWKLWDKGLQRYLSIWELSHVLDPDFFQVLPLTPDKRRDNKLVYYVIEDAVQSSSLASSYVRKAPLDNGFEAYYTLMDGYVFAGATTASLLLNELTGFRFLKDETPTAMILRLEELFQDMDMLPGGVAMTFNDTQRINYLLNTLRYEKEWQIVHSAIQSRQIKGDITFNEACEELKIRCEAVRVNELMDRPVGNKVVKIGMAQIQDEPLDLAEQIHALISSVHKKHSDGPTAPGKRKPRNKPSLLCLALDCAEMSIFPLCGPHYHALVAGKLSSIELRDQYGNATFDAATKMVVYPPKVPADRLPSNIRRVKAAAAKRTDAADDE
jgi:hypothetical protein